MREDFFLPDATVCIIGLGLMGGSLALALRGHCHALVGSDCNARTLEEASRQAVVDAADPDPARVLEGADVVILATPIPAILSLLEALPAILPDPCIVMDIGSAKRSVVNRMHELPERFEPVGGHPLCGKERLSLANAEPGLYRDAPFFLTPLERTTGRAISAARQIIAAIGAHPIVIDADEHDRGLALTSHLSFLLASALSLSVPAECSQFVGPGFRSTSRLAGTPASMMTGVLQSNRDNVLDALHRIQAQLSRMENALAAEEDVDLVEILHEAQGRYHALVQQ